MDRHSQIKLVRFGTDWKIYLLVCCLMASPAPSFNGGRSYECAVNRRALCCNDAGFTNSPLRKLYPRTFSPLCVHCFEWKPKFFPYNLWCGLHYWRMKKDPLLSCPLNFRALNASAKSCYLVWFDFRFGVWLVSDASSGVSFCARVIGHRCR